MTRKALKAQCDRLYSLWVRSSGYCYLCGSIYRLQCAHLFSRRYHGTRWSIKPVGAWCLCAKCHVYYTWRPLEWDQILRQHLGERTYQTLRRKALRGIVPDLARLKVKLQGLLR